MFHVIAGDQYKLNFLIAFKCKELKGLFEVVRPWSTVMKRHKSIYMIVIPSKWYTGSVKIQLSCTFIRRYKVLISTVALLWHCYITVKVPYFIKSADYNNDCN